MINVLIYATEMDNGLFMVSDYLKENSFLASVDSGEFLATYEGVRDCDYCGEGIFSLEFRESGNHYFIRLINAENGEFIDGEYSDRYDIKFSGGYATVQDSDGNNFVIDKDGKKYCEGYNPSGEISEGIVKIYNETTAGIMFLPQKK